MSTPTPWRIEVKHYNEGFGRILDAEDHNVVAGETDKLRIIVCDVNSHYRLMEACRHLSDLAEREGWHDYAYEGKSAIAASEPE